jgi:RNA-binding protein YlmH
MGWVKHHLAASGETVQGLIIARAVDESLQYALTNVSNVDVQLYEVDFRLKRPDSKVGKQRKGKA